MGEIFINGKESKSYGIYVDERDKMRRLELIVFLELNGFTLDKWEKRSPEAIIEGILPIDIDLANKEYRMMGNVTCAAAAASQKVLICRDEFFERYVH